MQENILEVPSDIIQSFENRSVQPKKQVTIDLMESLFDKSQKEP